jgi:hypothetical protein
VRERERERERVERKMTKKRLRSFYGVFLELKKELFPLGICSKILLDVSNNSITPDFTVKLFTVVITAVTL